MATNRQTNNISFASFIVFAILIMVSLFLFHSCSCNDSSYDNQEFTQEKTVSIPCRIASLDYGEVLAENDPLIEPYAYILEVLDKKIDCDQERIGDCVYVAKEAIKKRQWEGENVRIPSMLELLRATNQVIPDGEVISLDDYASILAYYAVSDL